VGGGRGGGLRRGLADGRGTGRRKERGGRKREGGNELDREKIERGSDEGEDRVGRIGRWKRRRERTSGR